MDAYWSSVSFLSGFTPNQDGFAVDEGPQSLGPLTHHGDVSYAPYRAFGHGNSAVEFGSSGGRLEIGSPAAIGFDFGTGDFTIELWLKPSDTTGWTTYHRTLIGNLQDKSYQPGVWTGSWALFVNPPGHGGHFTFRVMAPTGLLEMNGSTDITSTTTHHYIAVTRSGDTLRMYVDGVEDSTVSNITFPIEGTDTVNIGGGLLLDKDNSISDHNWIGIIDEVRITKGVARYTTDTSYSVPTVPLYRAPRIQAQTAQFQLNEQNIQFSNHNVIFSDIQYEPDTHSSGSDTQDLLFSYKGRYLVAVFGAAGGDGPGNSKVSIDSIGSFTVQHLHKAESDAYEFITYASIYVPQPGTYTVSYSTDGGGDIWRSGVACYYTWNADLENSVLDVVEGETAQTISTYVNGSVVAPVMGKTNYGSFTGLTRTDLSLTDLSSGFYFGLFSETRTDGLSRTVQHDTSGSDTHRAYVPVLRIPFTNKLQPASIELVGQRAAILKNAVSVQDPYWNEVSFLIGYDYSVADQGPRQIDVTPSGSPSLTVPIIGTAAGAYNRSGGGDYRNYVPTDRVLKGLYGITWYWEFECNSTGPSQFNGYVAAVSQRQLDDSGLTYDSAENPIYYGSLGYRGSGDIWGNFGNLLSSHTAYGAGDVVMIAFNPASGGFWVGLNGTWSADPDVDPPNETSDDTGRNFTPVVQAREVGEGGTLRSVSSQFSYAIPSSCRALGDLFKPETEIWLLGANFWVEMGSLTDALTVGRAEIWHELGGGDTLTVGRAEIWHEFGGGDTLTSAVAELWIEKDTT